VAVTRRFPGVVALDEFTLDVGEGELVTFLGPSGCGKTTALRVAAGFESPDSGGVRLGARDITDLPAQRRNMGMVFQSYSLFPHLTVSENISFGLMVRGAPVPERAARAGEMMELVRITGLAERYPHQLSGGQQQRVALARALAFKPEVLLLDEPLSALDARVRTEVRDEIRSLQMTTGTTTIFVTHDQDEALAVSDRVCVMESGTVHQVASPMEIYQSPQTEFVARFVGESDTVLLRGRNILVRPEDLDITGGAGTGDFDATVVGVDFKGAWSNVVLETAVDRRKVRCSVTAGTSRDLKAGSLVGVCVKRELFALV
jgi:putative spermidine/putrescine transport system ATP-binding protein